MDKWIQTDWNKYFLRESKIKVGNRKVKEIKRTVVEGCKYIVVRNESQI